VEERYLQKQQVLKQELEETRKLLDSIEKMKKEEGNKGCNCSNNEPVINTKRAKPFNIFEYAGKPINTIFDAYKEFHHKTIT
jgi:hypothetical protein